MKHKIKPGKTGDSRTRKQPRPKDQRTKVPEAFKEFADYLLGKGYSNRTALGRIGDTERFLRWLKSQGIEIEAVTYGDILSYVQTLRKKVTQRTTSFYLNSLKHYFNFLQESEVITENPVSQIQIRGIKRKKLYHILSKNELESLYNNFEIPKEEAPHKNQNWFKTSLMASQRNKVMVGLMVYQGLTVQELASLTEQDIKLREGKIFVAGSRRSNERELKLEAHQILDLMEYQLKTRNKIVQQAQKQTDKFFISTGNGEYFHNTMQKLIKKLTSQHGKVTSTNQIRASVITHWLRLYNLRQVQYMAGHRFVSSTEAYQINDLDDLQEDIMKFHPIN